MPGCRATSRPTATPCSPSGSWDSRNFGVRASRHDLAVASVKLVLEGHHVLRGRALRALDHVELDLGAFTQAPMPIGLDGAVMAEDVLLAVVTRDEAEALVIIEPLDRSCRTHRLLLLVSELPECTAARVLHHPQFPTTRLRGKPPRIGVPPDSGDRSERSPMDRLQFPCRGTYRSLSDSLGCLPACRRGVR